MTPPTTKPPTLDSLQGAKVPGRVKRKRVKRVLTCIARIAPNKVATIIRIPGLVVASEANMHQHWRHRASRAKAQKQTVHLYLSCEIFPPLPVKCLMTRFGKKKLDDDNLAGAFKHVRDQIASHYGVDDGGDQIQWEVGQEIARDTAELGTQIYITALPGGVKAKVKQ